jgi:PadR family transcriptional regulator, regulatory protein AphA
LSLKHAILGFLNIKPFSGYDLWKLFNGSVNNYWSATHTQIYKALSELAEEKMVEVEVIRQELSPNKKVYHLVGLGKKELIAWLKTPLELSPIRDKLLVQFSFSDALDDSDIIRNLESYIKRVEEKLNILKSGNYTDYLKFARSKREKFLWENTLKHGILSYENELRWLKGSLRNFKKLFIDSNRQKKHSKNKGNNEKNNQ